MERAFRIFICLKNRYDSYEKDKLYSLLHGCLFYGVWTKDGIYSLETVDEEEYVVVKIDQSQLKDACIPY
jgi:hypothetical protein